MLPNAEFPRRIRGKVIGPQADIQRAAPQCMSQDLRIVGGALGAAVGDPGVEGEEAGEDAGLIIGGV